MSALAIPPSDAGLTARQRQVRDERMAMIAPAVAQVRAGASIHSAAQWLSSSLSQPLSKSTLMGWLRAATQGDANALAPRHTGRVRKARGWEARALYHYRQPTRPCIATVARWLRDEGFADANDAAVRRYLNSVPANLGSHSSARAGAHYHRQNIAPHIVRDTSNLPAGLVYQGDGHTCDVYVQHPNSGGHYRPELTIWIDVRSRYIAGWWLSESESAVTTLYSLSAALVSHDHVPAYIHADPGSGFKARLVTDEVSGYLARYSISPIFALPGNAKGKGLVERLFGIFEERCGKRWPSYCGHCRTDDALSRLASKIAKGQIAIPSFAEYADSVRQFVAAWNAEAHDGEAETAAQLFGAREIVPLETPAAALVRPQVERVVQRTGVTLHNRLYRSLALAAVESQRVLVEYSLTDDRLVTVRDRAGRWLADAELVSKTPWLPQSRIEEGRQRRLVGQQQRLRARADELEARAREPITHEQTLRGLEDLGAAALPPAQTEEVEGQPPLDLLNTDY